MGRVSYFPVPSTIYLEEETCGICLEKISDAKGLPIEATSLMFHSRQEITSLSHWYAVWLKSSMKPSSNSFSCVHHKACLEQYWQHIPLLTNSCPACRKLTECTRLKNHLEFCMKTAIQIVAGRTQAVSLVLLRELLRGSAKNISDFVLPIFFHMLSFFGRTVECNTAPCRTDMQEAAFQLTMFAMAFIPAFVIPWMIFRKPNEFKNSFSVVAKNATLAAAVLLEMDWFNGMHLLPDRIQGDRIVPLYFDAAAIAASLLNIYTENMHEIIR